jgi:hypothetical protein
MDTARWLVVSIAILNARSEIEHMAKRKRDWAWRKEGAVPLFLFSGAGRRSGRRRQISRRVSLGDLC